MARHQGADRCLIRLKPNKQKSPDAFLNGIRRFWREFSAISTQRCRPQGSRTGFLIFIAHITARFEHRLNRLIERNIVTAVARHGKPGRGNRLRSRHRVAFNTRNLDLTRHRVACEPQMMLNTDFRRVLDLVALPPITAARPPAAMEQATPTSP